MFSRLDGATGESQLPANRIQQVTCGRVSLDTETVLLYQLACEGFMCLNEFCCVSRHRGTYFKSGQQKTDSEDGFLRVKSDFKSDVSILQQLVLRLVNWLVTIRSLTLNNNQCEPNSTSNVCFFPICSDICPENSVVTLRCTGMLLSLILKTKDSNTESSFLVLF